MEMDQDSTEFGYERSRAQRLNSAAQEQYKLFLRRSVLWVVAPLGILMLGVYWAFSLDGRSLLAVLTAGLVAMSLVMSGLAWDIYRRVDNAVASETPLMGALFVTVLALGVPAAISALALIFS